MKKKNPIDNYFFNMDWRHAIPRQMYFYVKMMDNKLLSQACVFFYLKYIKERENPIYSKNFMMLSKEVVLRKAKRLRISKGEFKKRYRSLEEELFRFLKFEEPIKKYGNKS